jgi:tetratricopeptide (TPR) repeat protein/DNA-binding MarR family transcriptional regulator
MGLQTYLPVEILDYIQLHEASEDTAYGISQRELARALGYHPCSMSRPLASLVQQGLLTAARGPVRDGQRKQLTYRLTPTGLGTLKKETRGVPLLSADLPLPPHPFLGRKDELDQLTEFANSGKSTIVIYGAPGMGKTALVSRHIKRSKRGRVPFWFTVRPVSSPRQVASALSHTLSTLGSPQLAYYAQLPRTPVAREVAGLVGRALAGRGLAAVLDDIQLAGPDLRKFLAEFILTLGRSGDHKFYLVGQEPDPVSGVDAELQRLTVGGLDRTAAHELTDRHGGLADRFEKVYQSTLGSPLLLRLAVSNPELAADATTLPTAVVSRVSDVEIASILPIALASEPLPIDFLIEDLGLPRERLDELGRMGVLYLTPQDRGEMLQVIRTAVMGRVGPADEREAHLRLARFYTRSHRPEAVRERFLHLVGGEGWKEAARLLDDQQRAVLRLGYSETLRLALRHLASALPHGSSKVRVLLVEAALLRHHSDYAEAIATLHRAIQECDGDERVTCEARLSIVELHTRLTQIKRAEEEFAAARQIGPVSRRLQAYFLLSQARIEEGKGQSQVAADHYHDAFNLAKKVHAEDLALESIVAWSRWAGVSSGPESALRLIDSALPDARQAGRVDIVFNLVLTRARAYALMGRSDLAESEMESIKDEAESLGYLNQLTYTLSGLAAALGEQGRWADSVNYAKQAITLAERLGSELVLGHTLAIMCASELRQATQGGDSALASQALVHGERSVEVLRGIAPTDSLILAHVYLSEVKLFLGDGSGATESYKEALSLADTLKVAWLRQQIVDDLGPRIGQPTVALGRNAPGAARESRPSGKSPATSGGEPSSSPKKRSTAGRAERAE